MIELRETAFMGKMTAGVTHEMKNVLAIIRESAGLMEDLLALYKDASFKYQEKFSRMLSKIEDQVARGVELSTRLNRLAHTPDQTAAAVDLAEAIGDVVFLSLRFARVKGVSLKSVPLGRPLMIFTDPMRFKMVIFAGIDLLVDIMEQNTELCLRTTENDDAVASIDFYSEIDWTERIPLPISSPEWSAFLKAVQDLEGIFKAGEPPLWFSLIFDQYKLTQQTEVC